MKLYTVKSSAHRAAKQAGFEKDQYEIVEIDGQFGYKLIEAEAPVAEVEEPVVPAIAEEAHKAAPKRKIEITNHSTIERPTKAVWHIADEMVAANPQVRRKDVIAECVNRGIAFYTARTQYQQWLATKNGTAK